MTTQSHDLDPIALSPQTRRRAVPAPRTVPGAMDEQDVSHLGSGAVEGTSGRRTRRNSRLTSSGASTGGVTWAFEDDQFGTGDGSGQRLADRDWSADIVVGIQQESRYVDLGQHVTQVWVAGECHGPEAAWMEGTDAVEAGGNEVGVRRWGENGGSGPPAPGGFQPITVNSSQSASI